MNEERLNKLRILRDIVNGVGGERWNELKSLEIYFLGQQSSSCACKYNQVLSAMNAEYNRTFKKELDEYEANN